MLSWLNYFDQRRQTYYPLQFLFACLVLIQTSALATEEHRASLLERANRAAIKGDHRAAISALDELLKSSTNDTDAIYLRGRAHFCAGEIKASFNDFEQLVELKPQILPRLWERGITCYYAEQFQKGVEQFESYQEFDDNDVENAVWHFLCLARLTSIENAREKMLRTRYDRRIPMQAVYELYAGKRTPESVIEFADQAPPGVRRRSAKFYAHLYVGLYFDAQGKPAMAKPHVKEAATTYRIAHYMGDVAEVHWRRLQVVDRPNSDQQPQDP